MLCRTSTFLIHFQKRSNTTAIWLSLNISIHCGGYFFRAFQTLLEPSQYVFRDELCHIQFLLHQKKEEKKMNSVILFLFCIPQNTTLYFLIFLLNQRYVACICILLSLNKLINHYHIVCSSNVS